MMNATYTQPEWVFTYVRSANHNRFGAVAVKSRSTRSAGRSASPSGMVVRTQDRPLRTPDRPMWRIRRSTVQRATPIPSTTLRWSHILSAP